MIETGDISGLLDYLRVFGKRQKYTFAARRDAWQGAQPHLALLVDEDEEAIRWLGRAQGGPIITNRERRVEVADIKDVGEIRLEGLRQRLANRYKNHLDYGVLPPATGKAVVQALIDMYPHLAETIERLGRPKEFRLPSGAHGRLLNEQRDGVGLLLDIGGIGREPLREWTPHPTARASFLAGVTQRFVSEETLIDHDVGRFPELALALGADVDWQIFEGQNRRMFVMNANMEPVENTLGVDVVYFNETFKSFVLVQYKRLIKESAGGKSKLWYRPDSNLSTELERMNRVDNLYGSREGDFRLFGQACWVKLCDPSATQDPVQLISGMYLAREYFIQLLDICKGPQGGVRLGYDNVPRHITNTLFVRLVKDGWIGTCGTGTEELGEVIRMVLENRHALVLGVPA